MRVLIAIPARFGSSRFPGKPLADINGKSMILRVVEQCRMVQTSTKHQIDIIVATDDERIYDHIKSYNEVRMTSSSHQSGTDRVAEIVANTSQRYDLVINVQGDEPFIHPGQITQLIECFELEDVQIATLIKPVKFKETLNSPNIVKCVVDNNFKALYFSRFAIPFFREEHERVDKIFYKHVGMYGFIPSVLIELTGLPVSKLEKAERLEQLRWLENGYRIQTAITEFENIAVDSPEDIELIKRMKLV